MKLARTLAIGAAVLGLTMAAAAAPAVAAGPAAAPYPICYGAEASVMNKYGQNAAYGKTGWCLDDRGYFETTTGWNSIKDLVNGDGVAARIWLWGEYQDGTQFKFARATDYTTTSGATTWGFSGYLDHMSIHVCLGSAQPGTGSAYCEEMSPTIRYPW